MEKWSEIKAVDECSASTERIEKLGIFPQFFPKRMYACKEASKYRPPTPEGALLSVRHDNEMYAEYLSESGVIYLYPETKDPQTDVANICSARQARELELPVFVIVKASKKTSRDVHLGWITDIDDDLKTFYIAFGDEPPIPIPSTSADEEFELFYREPRNVVSATVTLRDKRFREAVFARYGASCAFCGICTPEVLDAAHIVSVKSGGIDDPLNGLVLCALHHRAFDAGLVAIDPNDLSLRTRENGPTLTDLRISRTDLNHLTPKPHFEALTHVATGWSRK